VVEANRGGKAGGCGKLARFGIDVFEANREMEVVTAVTVRPMLRRLALKAVSG
jgi:molybdenum-dependent DNA-binding transcriptional regulator ModE